MTKKRMDDRLNVCFPVTPKAAKVAFTLPGYIVSVTRHLLVC